MSDISSKMWNFLETIIYWFVNTFYKIIGKELTEGQWEAFLQFVKFCMVGVSNSILTYFINIGSLLIFGKLNLFPNYDYILANVITFILTVLWSFYWNNKYVFKLQNGEKRNLGLALLKTYLSYAFTGIILNNILSVIWIEVLHISKFIAPVINIIVSMPINFLINKFWSFRAKK